ncbi:MAG: hypothetical protein AB7O52_01555 [Planctomycetota bacterium]
MSKVRVPLSIGVIGGDSSTAEVASICKAVDRVLRSLSEDVACARFSGRERALRQRFGWLPDRATPFQVLVATGSATEREVARHIAERYQAEILRVAAAGDAAASDPEVADEPVGEGPTTRECVLAEGGSEEIPAGIERTAAREGAAVAQPRAAPDPQRFASAAPSLAPSAAQVADPAPETIVLDVPPTATSAERVLLERAFVTRFAHVLLVLPGASADLDDLRKSREIGRFVGRLERIPEPTRTQLGLGSSPIESWAGGVMYVLHTDVVAGEAGFPKGYTEGEEKEAYAEKLRAIRGNVERFNLEVDRLEREDEARYQEDERRSAENDYVRKCQIRRNRGYLLSASQRFDGQVAEDPNDLPPAFSSVSTWEDLSEHRGIRGLANFYARADTLALEFKDRCTRALSALCICAGLAALAFGIQSHVLTSASEPLGFAFYLLLLSVGACIHLWVHRASHQKKHLDYRAVAEGLRVQWAWRVAGLADHAAVRYLGRQSSELDWIRYAIEVWGLRVRPLARAAGFPARAFVYRTWVVDQLTFFAGKAPEKGRQSQRLRIWAGSGIFASLALTWFLTWSHAHGWLVPVAWGVLAVGAAFVLHLITVHVGRSANAPHRPPIGWFLAHYGIGIGAAAALIAGLLLLGPPLVERLAEPGYAFAGLHPWEILAMILPVVAAGLIHWWSEKMAFGDEAAQYERMITIYHAAIERLEETMDTSVRWDSDSQDALHEEIRAILAEKFDRDGKQTAPPIAEPYSAETIKTWSARVRKAAPHDSQLFARTCQALAVPARAGLQAESLPVFDATLRELGREALAENGDWVLMHRERPIEVAPPGG